MKNPQQWLPIGQTVRMPAGMYSPNIYSADAPDWAKRLSVGQIVEHLANGFVAIKFGGYPHVVYYTAREAAQFSKLF